MAAALSFLGIQFSDDDSIAIVSKAWLTPRKQEVLWPPIKKNKEILMLLQSNSEPSADWPVFGIKRCFFECSKYTDFHLFYYSSSTWYTAFYFKVVEIII